MLRWPCFQGCSSRSSRLRRPCSLDIFLCVFQSPEGRTENSPGLQAWEGLRKENRPERAADFRALFPRGNPSPKATRWHFRNYESLLVQKSAGTIRCERDCAVKCNNNISLRWRPMPCSDALSGRFRCACGSQASRPGLFSLRPSSDKNVEVVSLDERAKHEQEPYWSVLWSGERA